MPKLREFHATLSNFEFSPESLTFTSGSALTVTISHSLGPSSSIYAAKDRFFIFYVVETGEESPPLYRGDSFRFEFLLPGLYHLNCFNYVRIGMVIRVSEEGADETNGFSEGSVFEEGSKHAKSLFSEEPSELRRFKLDGLETISNCLESLVIGEDVDKIRDEFKPLFDEENEENIELDFDSCNVIATPLKKQNTWARKETAQIGDEKEFSKEENNDKKDQENLCSLARLEPRETPEDESFTLEAKSFRRETSACEESKLFEFTGVSTRCPSELTAIFERIEESLGERSFASLEEAVASVSGSVGSVVIQGRPSSPYTRDRFLRLLEQRAQSFFK